jgi:hypothetical protein
MFTSTVASSEHRVQPSLRFGEQLVLIMADEVDNIGTRCEVVEGRSFRNCGTRLQGSNRELMHNEARDPLLHEEQDSLFAHTVDPEADSIVVRDQESKKSEVVDVDGRKSSL